MARIGESQTHVKLCNTVASGLSIHVKLLESLVASLAFSKISFSYHVNCT